MRARLLTVAFDVQHPEGVARFWSSVLGRRAVADAGGWRLPPEGDQVGLRFVRNAARKSAPNRIHLHLTSATSADQLDKVARALDLGARHVDVGQRPDEGHVVLADPGDNEFCVIEPGNAFLAGCGLLGEVACDGTREVGLFWSAALDWPLVWDHHGETAVQSPSGGTKVAWGGPPIALEVGRSRQRLELGLEGDLATEVDRLVSLGAGRLENAEDGSVVLADPDGNEFSVSPVSAR